MLRRDVARGGLVFEKFLTSFLDNFSFTEKQKIFEFLLFRKSHNRFHFEDNFDEVCGCCY